MFIPVVLDKINNNEKSFDIFSRLLEDRIIFLNGEINGEVASSVIAQMLFLENKDASKPIYLYINSPGGSVDSGLAICDTMEILKCEVRTICVGMCASMAAIILSCGSVGGRSALKHSRIMIHQPLGGVEGKACDIKIATDEILKIREVIIDILARNTTNTREKIEKDIQLDYYMNSYEGKDYGIIDEILGE